MIHGDYAGYVAESGIDSVTQYELWKAIWSSLNDRNFYELAQALERHAELLEHLRAADVPRQPRRHPDRQPARRPRHLPHALALLFALPGVPTVTTATSSACAGVKEEREGGDDAIRPAAAGRPEPPVPDARRGRRAAPPADRPAPPAPVAGRRRVEATDVTNTGAVVVATPREGDERPLRLVLNLADDVLPLPDGAEVLEAGPLEGHAVAGHSWAVVTG